MILFVGPENIDRERWDRCVAQSQAGLIYGFSWYLDIVFPGWCGLVKDDYSAVMPIPVKKKFSFNYILQPGFTQQLGVFSPEKCGPEVISDFLKALPECYRFVDINLNFSNDTSGLQGKVIQRRNYELHLSESSEKIRSGYSKNTIRNLRKAANCVEIREDLDPEDFMKVIKINKHIVKDPEQYAFIKYFTGELQGKNAGSFLAAYCKNELCACVFLLSWNSRIYYLIPASTGPGREKSAMFLIIDHLVGRYSGTDHVLDFEGSNLENIARFYEGFGATATTYSRIRINRLPFPVNMYGDLINLWHDHF